MVSTAAVPVHAIETAIAHILLIAYRWVSNKKRFRAQANGLTQKGSEFYDPDLHSVQNYIVDNCLLHIKHKHEGFILLHVKSSIISRRTQKNEEKWVICRKISSVLPGFWVRDSGCPQKIATFQKLWKARFWIHSTGQWILRLTKDTDKSDSVSQG